ncbi:PopZ family protein [Mesorhizobium sp. KR2-14]|uniref:PopZ family protein n=1 Tax=Mesorhizobium sp. KR2-14 TaxID=3156610 RepID=UPI0032B611BC
MAQASNAQREPSMEEILASIRRIIEDSDSARKGAEDTLARDEAGSDRLDGAVIEVDAFRAELRAARAAPEVDRSLSLAEVQARIASEAEYEREPAASDFEIAAQQPETAGTHTETPALAMPEWSVTPHAEPEEVSSALDAFDQQAAAPRHEPVAEYVAEPEAAREEPAIEYPVFSEPARVDPVSAPTPSEAVRPAIISEHAGRQVAAAFGELSEAFAARSRKTFDEMAEQMLRPMLQDWLDNNLPTLVERLVREEIERVARGG